MKVKGCFALFLLVLLVTACNSKIKVQMDEIPSDEPTIEDAVVDEPTDANDEGPSEGTDTVNENEQVNDEKNNGNPVFIPAVEKSYSYDTRSDLPDTFCFSTKVDVQEEAEYIQQLEKNENTEQLMQIYRTTCNVLIPIEKINEDYLKWLKESNDDSDKFAYDTIMTKDHQMTILTVYSSKDMVENALYYGVVLKGDKGMYHGEESAYGYKEGDGIQLSDDVTEQAMGGEDSQSATAIFDTVTFERPWYMDFCRNADGCDLVMRWEEFCELKEANFEPTPNGFQPYIYCIKAKKGKGEDLRAAVKELFGESAWVNEDSYFN